MGYATLAVLGITAVALLFGTLWGLWRGRNRAILRLVLVVICAVAAFVLKDTVSGILMGVNMGSEGSLQDMLMGAFASGDAQLPESMVNLVFTLVQIMIGLVLFIVLFIVLRIFTFFFVYPFCKIFVKKGVVRHRGIGALVGLVQGIVIAFVTCAPVTGLLVQVDRLSSVEMNGQPLLDLPAEIGIGEYVNSPVGGIYNAAGGWFFDMITTGTTEDGKNVSLDSTVEAATTVMGIADSFTSLSESIEAITAEDATPQERVDAMQELGTKLAEVGSSIEEMGEDAKDLLNDLVADVGSMMGGEGEEMPPEMEEFLADFDLDSLNFTALGNGINGIATYVEKTTEGLDGEGEVTQSDVTSIVNAFADNMFILDLMGEDVPEFMDGSEHEDLFTTAINATELTAEEKTKLLTLFGL